MLQADTSKWLVEAASPIDLPKYCFYAINVAHLGTNNNNKALFYIGFKNNKH